MVLVTIIEISANEILKKTLPDENLTFHLKQSMIENVLHDPFMARDNCSL
jgi:hypothetical protein